MISRAFAMRTFVTICLVLLAILAVRLCVYTVDASEYAYVTVLGKPAGTFDGSDGERGAGLHIGWPWPVQTVQRLDRRLQHFDLPDQEILTHDPDGNTIDKTLSIKAYICWKIADLEAVDLFIKSLGTPERARSILGPRVTSQLGAVITQMAMSDLVSTDAGAIAGKTKVDEKMAGLHEKLLAGLKGPLRQDYGIELVDIRLQRFNHPSDVREAIYQRIRSEREKKATEHRSEGKRLAQNIESTADEKAREILAKADFDKKKLEGDADAEAMTIRNQAHQQDPEFYTLLAKLNSLQSILVSNKTMLLLSTNRPIFDLLFHPPQPGMNGQTP